jgi:hypothetical protein
VVLFGKDAFMRRDRSSKNRVRKANVVLILYGMGMAALVWTWSDALTRGIGAQTDLRVRADLVHQLELTDLTLFTEARYTRHLSQADLHSAFQDHPMALDHFPSGSLVMPHRGHLRGGFRDGAEQKEQP